MAHNIEEELLNGMKSSLERARNTGDIPKMKELSQCDPNWELGNCADTPWGNPQIAGARPTHRAKAGAAQAGPRSSKKDLEPQG